MLTTQQVRQRTKTVTRRLGWWNLRTGDLLQACVKCMGLKKGESPELLAVIRVVNVRSERLSDLFHCRYGDSEAKKEGFPELTGKEFVEFFQRHQPVNDEQIVNRIEFEYVDAIAVAAPPKAGVALEHLDTAAASLRTIAQRTGVDPMALSHVNRAIEHINEAYVCLNEPGKGRSITELLYDIHWLAASLRNHKTSEPQPTQLA